MGEGGAPSFAQIGFLVLSEREVWRTHVSDTCQYPEFLVRLCA